MDKADFEAGRKITVPLLVIWGARGGALSCGHYVPEEAPEETLDWLLRHFAQ
jgi:hypothetical protein